MTHPLEPLVTAAYADRALLGKDEHREAVLKAIAGLDDGTLRIAEKGAAGWTVNVWLKEAVLAANTVLTASTRIIDVTGPEPRESRGRIPARSVVIPGSVPKQFPAGTYAVPCALVIGQRSESTDRKTSLNQALRDFAVPV